MRIRQPVPVLMRKSAPQARACSSSLLGHDGYGLSNFHEGAAEAAAGFTGYFEALQASYGI
jgi:hypothetical protein